MSSHVELLGNENEREWDEFVHRHESGTFFHLTGWKRVVEKTFGFEPKYMIAIDGGQFKGILPLFRIPLLPFGQCLISVPFAVYGGICSEDAETELNLLNSAIDILSGINGKYIEFRNIKSSHLPLPKKDLYVTFRRPILPTEEANMSAIPRKERAEIRRGIRNNLSSRWGGDDVLDSFYYIYSYSVRNLGTPVFPKALFKNLLDEFKDKCKILTILHGEKIVAAVMTFFFKDQVMPYYAGGLKEYLPLSVNDFMYWDLLCYGRANGYKVFDFGRSKKGTGSFKFKEHWGFVPDPLQYQYYLTRGTEMPNISPSNPKYSLAISLWKKMPISLTMKIGPRISRYLC